MSTHKHIDRICAAALLFTLALTVLFVNGEALGVQPASRSAGYETRLFDTTRVHTIDLVMEDWEAFLETCENEEYAACAAVIDGEACRNIGLRAKGNTSLSTVSAMGSSRYSLKLEFDHYDAGKSYYGLDKLCLNNVIQDNTYLKDYLTYRMMAEFGAVSPLCSFAFITVNGEDWGLYLAVEGVEESFLRRNYGREYGDLYKPDSMDFGGGRGNGREFFMEDMESRIPGLRGEGENVQETGVPAERDGGQTPLDRGFPEGESGRMPNFPGAGALDGPPETEPPSGGGPGGGGPGGMGSGDVKLQYTDDNPESYANIFDSAKTEVTEADQARLIQALRILGEGMDVESAVDVDQVLRYFVVHNFVVNGDSYTGSMVHNYYLYEEDGKLSMLPWDYNLAFGTFQAGDASAAVNDPIDTPLSVTGEGDRPMMDWILSAPAYTELYHQYFSEFLETVDPAAIIGQAYDLIAPYVERDPTKFCTCEAFETGVEALRTFCRLRAESVSGQLAGTIPSTTAGQSDKNAAPVDTGGLVLSDMGTMNMGGGHGGPDMGSFPERGGHRAAEGEENSPEPPEMGGPGEMMPNRAGSRTEDGTAPDRETLLLLGLAALALPAGLFIAWRYRRHGRQRARSGGGVRTREAVRFPQNSDTVERR